MMDGSSESGAIQYPQWQIALKDALLELDQERLRAKIQAAEAAILERQRSMAQDSKGDNAELVAISDALSALRALKRADPRRELEKRQDGAA